MSSSTNDSTRTPSVGGSPSSVRSPPQPKPLVQVSLENSAEFKASASSITGTLRKMSVGNAMSRPSLTDLNITEARKDTTGDGADVFHSPISPLPPTVIESSRRRAGSFRRVVQPTDAETFVATRRPVDNADVEEAFFDVTNEQQAALMEVDIQPTAEANLTSSAAAVPIFQEVVRPETSMTYHSQTASANSVGRKHIDMPTALTSAIFDNPMRLQNALDSGGSVGLNSPTDVIFESEIFETMAGVMEVNLNDTGMGPGRIRRFADQDPNNDAWKEHKKHFFVLSSAGKPIYSRYGDENKLSTFTGVIQAIISFYQDNDDVIRSIKAGPYTIVFLLKAPLFFLVASRTAEPETALKEQLQWLYHQIVSIITYAQLHRIFDQHHNFDLRRLLGGTEPFLDHLCRTVGSDPGYILGAIHAVRMPVSVRNSVGTSLQLAHTHCKEELLYGMLIVDSKLITILRPKRHSFHPSDLHLIFNMVNSSSSFKSAPESWMPICLPKFNDNGFLHAYVSYITPTYPGAASNLCLILVSHDRDKFFELSECRKKILQHMSTSGSLFSLQNAIRSCDYSINDIGIAGLRHFLYKSKSCIQFTMPLFSEPYKGKPKEQKRIFRLYQQCRSQMQQRSRPLKVFYMVCQDESVFGWNTGMFELYATFGPLVTKPNVTNAVNALLRWLKKDEEQLFILNAPTFS